MSDNSLEETFNLVRKGINAQNTNGNTALILATSDGHTEIVTALLAQGADVNAQNENDNTALMCAAYGGHTEIVTALVAQGADVNAQNKDGETALMWATRGGHKEVEKILEQAATLTPERVIAFIRKMPPPSRAP